MFARAERSGHALCRLDLNAVPLSVFERKSIRFETRAYGEGQRRRGIETADFTSLCPVTGQVDFAQITIEYVPAKLCVESKSLKFYLASYRNERAFNEAVTNRILDDFVRACAPREATVTAEFSARGGIALTVRAEFPDAK